MRGRLLLMCCMQVAQIRKNSISQLGRLAEHAGSPSLLLLAAQKQTGQAQQHPAQQAPPGAASSPAGSPASPEAPAAGCPVKEVQLSCLFDHMALYGVLVAFVVLDSLTTTQKARWLVSSYPWCVWRFREGLAADCCSCCRVLVKT